MMTRTNAMGRSTGLSLAAIAALLGTACESYWSPDPPIQDSGPKIGPNNPVGLAGSIIWLSCERHDLDTQYPISGLTGEVKWDSPTLVEDQMSNDANFWPKWHVNNGTIIGPDVGVTYIRVQLPDQAGSCQVRFDDDDLPTQVDPEYGNRDDSPATPAASTSVAVVVPRVYEVGWPSHTMYDRDPNKSEWDDSSISLPFPQLGPNHATAPVCLTKGSTPWIGESCKIDQLLTADTMIVVKADGTFHYTESEARFPGGGTSTGTSHDLIGTLPMQVCNWGVWQDWKYRVPSGSNSWIDMNRTENPLYVTYSQPGGSCVTTERVYWVCRYADGKSEPNEIAEAIFQALPNETYNLDANVDGPRPIWLIYDGQQSQCPGLATFVGVHFSMVGMPDWQRLFCYALPDLYFLDPNHPWNQYATAFYHDSYYGWPNDPYRWPSETVGHDYPTAHDDMGWPEYLWMVAGGGQELL